MIVSRSDDGIEWLIQVPWMSTFALVSLAAAVIFFGWYLQKRSGNLAASRGRGGRTSLKKFDLPIARLEALPVTPIGRGKSGNIHLEGRLASAVGSLGGDPRHACIWHNRAGAGRDAAVGTELVLLADDSGQVAIENISAARVIAPVEAHAGGRESVSLYLGDRVQVLGKFTAEVIGKDEDPKMRVYGYLGRQGPIQIRLLDRFADAPETLSQEEG